MEDKQLNLNQPLLSVRRFPSTVTSETYYKRKIDNSLARLPPLPAYKSELKSCPVRNPGTVPFVWEKAPGRPKDQSKLQAQAVKRPTITPSLPPGRVLKVKQDSDVLLKGTSDTELRTGSTVSNSQNVASLDKKVTKREREKMEIQEKTISDSDEEYEAYLDALDTLSRTESLFTNCSVSGLSGCDVQEVQPSESFLTDQQARDFMIGRFLPAARAMTSETPQYNSRKPLVGQEQQRQVRKVASAERSHPLNQHGPKIWPHCAQYFSRELNKDESNDYNGSENYATTICGLFPRFCLLNPIPGLRKDDRVLSSEVNGTQAKSMASHSETAKERHARTASYGKKSADSQFGFIEEKDFLGIPEKSKQGIDPHRRGCSKLLACERTQCESNCGSPVVEKTLYVDSVHKVKSHSSSCSSEMRGQTNRRGDEFETSERDSSIYKNPPIDSSLEDNKHLSVVGEKATLQPRSSESLDSSFLVCSVGNSSNYTQLEITNHSKKVGSERQGLTKPGNRGSDLDQDLVVISSPKVVEFKKIDLESQVSSTQKCFDSLIQNPNSWKNLKLAGDLEVDLKSQRATNSIDQECTDGHTRYPTTLASSKVGGDYGKIDLESQCFVKFGHQQTSDASYLQLPFALPLPKAPSESWLKRTLPTTSPKNKSSPSNLAANIYARSQTPKTTPLHPKSETIGKSSNTHHDHRRFSEEVLTPIPEASTL